MDKMWGGRHVALGYAVLVAAALIVSVMWPPVVEFTARPALGLALVVLGAVGLLAPLRHGYVRYLRIAAATLLWGVVAWCALSQIAPLSQSPTSVWSLRLFPVVIGASLWGLLLLGQTWQRRALVALLLPTLSGLALVAWTAPAQPKWFSPQYIAVDSHGTVYISNRNSNVIRVFAPDGALRAKLRPQVAKELGIPGPGFEQPGVSGEPDQLGAATPGAFGGVGAPARGPGLGAGEEEANFRTCGLAVDRQDRLYVPDMGGHVLLRFKPDGHLDAKWPLSFDLAQAAGCAAIAGDTLYLLSDSDALLRYNLAGYPLPALALPETPRSGLVASADGKTLFAVGQDHVLALDVGTGVAKALPVAFPPPSAPIYQPLLALPGNRLLVANAPQSRIDAYCDAARLCSSLGGPGSLPGQFGHITSLAQDGRGNLYVADDSYALVQRLTPSGRATALYWSPDDDAQQTR